MKLISRPYDYVSPDGECCTADISKEPDMTAAPLHYLVMPFKKARRVTFLSAAAQDNIWQYTEDMTAHALRRHGINSVNVLLNDGYASGQTIGHLHIHIVGFERQRCFNHEECMDKLLDSYNKQPLTYQVRMVEKLRISEIGAFMRSELKDYFSEDYGFSILSRSTFNSVSDGQYFVFQIFGSEHPRSYGLTNLTRVMCGLRECPTDWNPANKKATYDLYKR